MRSFCCGSILFSSILLLVSIQFLLLSADSSVEDNAGGGKPRNLSIQLPKIFDWDRYKVSFQKIYPTIKDELIRRKLFLANALKTFLHNLAFRLGKSSHYLSVNQFTDYSPEEIKKLYSGLKLEKGEFDLISNEDDDENNNSSSDSQQEVDLDLDQLQQELARIIEEKQPGFEIVARELGVKIDDTKNRLNNYGGDNSKRMKSSNRGANRYNRKKNRHSKEATKRSHADMDINEFRSMIDDIAPEESDKLVESVPSTNDHYQSIDRSTGQSNTADFNESQEEEHLSDEKIDNLKWQVPSTNYIRDQLSKLSGYFSPGQNQDNDNPERGGGQVVDDEDDGDDDDSSSFFSYFDAPLEMGDNKIVGDSNGLVQKNMARLRGRAVSNDDDMPGLEDKVFLDWRSSGCLTVTRDQKNCGSCYAFTAIALMEFLHCKQTGNLVPFSEQYMVDCGLSHVDQINGCDGTSSLASMAIFLMNWGVELRSNYPYMAKETQCPYKSDDWEHAGFKRPSIKDFKTIQQRAFWPGILKYTGPMIAVITVPRDFSFYGGLVHEGNNCDTEDGLHAMLLVGHGIEDGQEYWLYRNSHGYYWGEQGYFKLSKKAKNNCFGPHTNTNFDFGEQSKPVEIVEGNKRKKLTPYEAYMRKMR